MAIEHFINESRDNTIREVRGLGEHGYVSTTGEARATVYSITPKARTIVLWDDEEYLTQEPDKRHALYTTLPEYIKIVYTYR